MEQLVDGAPARAEQQKKYGRDPERHDRQRRLLTLLRTVCPRAFPSSPVPLAVGIRRQLAQVACDGTFQWQDVAAVLQLWTRRQDYIAAVARGEPRRNLDGSGRIGETIIASRTKIHEHVARIASGGV